MWQRLVTAAIVTYLGAGVYFGERSLYDLAIVPLGLLLSYEIVDEAREDNLVPLGDYWTLASVAVTTAMAASALDDRLGGVVNKAAYAAIVAGGVAAGRLVAQKVKNPLEQE